MVAGRQVAAIPAGEDEFRLEQLGIEIACPACGHQMVGDGNGLVLAESPNGAMLACGRCARITQWRFVHDPLRAEEVVPITWGGRL